MNRAEGDVDQKVFNTFFDDGRKDRVFVDVGAARPDYLSVSAMFRQKGWRIIAVEPNPEFAALHRYCGHEVFEYACGTEDRDDVEFCVANSNQIPYEGGNVSYEGFSSLSLKPGYKSLLPETVNLKQIKVKMRRLDTILSEAGVNSIDVLSIDVEGWELEVLAGLDIKRYSPRVMVVENFLNDDTYVEHIEAMGYERWKTLTPNQVFVRPGMLKKLPIVERLKRMLGRAG